MPRVNWPNRRLAVYAQDHPDRCARLIVETQRRLGMRDCELEFYLGLDDIGLARLALCPCPDHETADIAKLATMVGCSEEQIRRLFTDEAEVEADARTDERATPRPFRLDSDETMPF